MMEVWYGKYFLFRDHFVRCLNIKTRKTESRKTKLIV